MRVTRFPARAEGPADRVAGFVAHLRLNGLQVGPGQIAEVLAALTHVSATDPQQARLALRCTLARDPDMWRRFEDLFDAFWFNSGAQRHDRASPHMRSSTSQPKVWRNHLSDSGQGPDGATRTAPEAGSGEAEGTKGRLIATRTDSLRQRDLRDVMDADSLRAAEAAAYRLARAIRDRRSRRRKAARRGRMLDLRRMQRAALARGGEPLDLCHRIRPPRPMRLVVLTDISGSMSVYARPFLAFIKGLISVDTRAEGFLFHTRLLRVTPALRDKDSLRAAGRLSLMAEGFGGGTDIGGALATLVSQHGRTLGGRSMVLILSDGYCTGPPERVAQALARIQRKARRVVWLNPLLGWRDYAPVTAAMQAALPHLDAHLPANTIDALGALEHQFAKL